ncbi:MAG: peptide transporter [bacterium]|nr:peptide transporter [bacterium]
MKQYREITLSASILGVILGIIMTMSFVYAGLKLGFTLAGSTIAALLGFVVLKGILRKGTIIENNINQTIASGINIASSGIIFTLPALLLMGKDFSPWKMAAAAIAGSFLGITVIIPLRKQMIEIDRLRFPSGTAVAAILKSPGEGVQKAVLLLTGFTISMLFVIAIKLNLLPGEIPLGKWLGMPDYTQTVIALSLMNIGAGMLAGKGGIPFALGGILAFWIIGPASVAQGWTPAGLSEQELSIYIYKNTLRPLGIGLMIGGALMGVIAALPSIKSAFKSLSAAAAAKQGPGKDELNIRTLYIACAISMIVIFAGAYTDPGITLIRAILVSITGTLWIGIAGLIVAQCTGLTDISPVSGLSLIAITLILIITGGNIVTAVMIGVAVCVAISQCADMMQDLKTGHLVGSIPRKQQLVQYAVAWVGPVVAIATMFLLWKTNSGSPGFGPESTACKKNLPGCLSAPQAGALQAMIEGILRGDVPLDKYISGGVIGSVLTIIPVGGLGVLVGLAMYLPFSITLGFGIGSCITVIISKLKSPQFVEGKIVPLAAGLLIGEALTELVHSMSKLMGGS